MTLVSPSALFPWSPCCEIVRAHERKIGNPKFPWVLTKERGGKKGRKKKGRKKAFPFSGRRRQWQISSSWNIHTHSLFSQKSPTHWQKGLFCRRSKKHTCVCVCVRVFGCVCALFSREMPRWDRKGAERRPSGKRRSHSRRRSKSKYLRQCRIFQTACWSRSLFSSASGTKELPFQR